MTATGIMIDERFRRHVTGAGHPETPERLTVIHEALEESGLLDSCVRIPAKRANEGLVQMVHTHGYLTRLDAACRQCYPYLDVPDCPICPESYEIALLAVGGVLTAVRQVANGDLKRAFCAVRPPGHHAERDRPMGFCLFNNIAIAACALKSEYEFTRLLILDFDIHHGNGTQHAFEADPSVQFISLHGHPTQLFPGTGYEEEIGVDAGRGYTMNIPLMAGAGDDDYKAAFAGRVLPAMERFAPQMILLSVGFDSHVDDPVGNMLATDEIFSWMTERILEVADRHAEGRVVSVLEGGYNPGVLRRCTVEHVRLLQA